MQPNSFDDTKSIVRGIVAYSEYGGLKVDLDELCRRVRGAEDLRSAVMMALRQMYPDVKTA